MNDMTQPSITVTVEIRGQQVDIKSSTGDTLQVMKVLAAAMQVVCGRMEVESKGQESKILRPGVVVPFPGSKRA